MLRTEADGTPIAANPFVHGDPYNFTDGHIAATTAGDLVISVNYGSSDEILLGVDPSMVTTWIKHNGNDLFQWGCDLRSSSDGGFLHIVKTSEAPNVRYFRSDPDQNIEGCYEDFSLTQPPPLTVPYMDAAHDLQPHPVTFSDYPAAVSELVVSEMMPCVAQGMNGSASDDTPRIWPVPATDHARVANLAPGGVVTLRDMTGKTLRSFRTGSTEATLDLSDLPVGMFVLDVPTVHGRTRLKLLK